MNLKRAVLGLFFIFPLFMNAQPGANDPTFNTADAGFGFGERAIGLISTILVQPDNKILIAGGFSSYNGTPFNSIARLNTDGTIDPSFSLLKAEKLRLDIRAIALQSDGKIILSGSFAVYAGKYRYNFVRLHTNGDIDTTFKDSFASECRSVITQPDNKIIVMGSFGIKRLNANGSPDETFHLPSNTVNVNSAAIQPDGKIIVGGQFTSFDGVAANNIVRLNADGTVDSSFNIGTGADDSVKKVALLSSGKIVIMGSFSSFNQSTRRRIARLNTDGSLDVGFDPEESIGEGSIYDIACNAKDEIIISGSFSSYFSATRYGIAKLASNGSVDSDFFTGSNPKFKSMNWYISRAAFQADGKILIIGLFKAYNNIPCVNFDRLNADATLDLSFREFGSGLNFGAAVDVTVQPDDKIIVSGAFLKFNNLNTPYLLRLKADGSYDNSFNIGTGPNGVVNKSIVQADGKIIVVGDFTSFNGGVKNRIVRLNADGSIDNSFAESGTGPNGAVTDIALQSDGKIMIAGEFVKFGLQDAKYLVRLNADGTMDASFNSQVTPGMFDYDNHVVSLAIQTDGKILIGGYFTTYNNVNIRCLARLNSDGSVDNTFNIGEGFDGYYGYFLNMETITILPDGKILAGGKFNKFNGQERSGLVRLNSDGSLDNTFNFNFGSGGYVLDTKVQNDGKIIVGGSFTRNVTRNVIRVNQDGSLDETFYNGTGADNTVYSVALQNDERIVIAGNFFAYDGHGKNRIARVLQSCLGTVEPVAPAVESTELAICIGSSVVLKTKDVNLTHKASLKWYSESCGSAVIGEGLELTATAISDTTFFVRSEGGRCESPGACTEIKVKVIDPKVDAVVSDSLCAVSGSLTLKAFASDAKVLWYSGGLSSADTLESGGAFVTPEISGSISYFVSALQGGCESKNRVPVTGYVFAPPNISVYANEGAISASVEANEPTLQWINCEDNSPVKEQNGLTFQPIKSGQYALIASSVEGCATTSECVEIVFTDTENTLTAGNVYPNPNNGTFAIPLGTSVDQYITITNVNGKVVQSFMREKNQSDKITVSQPAGIYILKSMDKSKIRYYKIIIE